MIHGRFSLAPPNRGSGAIPAVIFGGIAPIANVVCARPSTEVECVFVHFPISSNFCEKCSTIQAFALVVPSGMGYQHGPWVHGKNPASVRSVQSETKKKLADDWSFQGKQENMQ